MASPGAHSRSPRTRVLLIVAGVALLSLVGLTLLRSGAEAGGTDTAQAVSTLQQTERQRLTALVDADTQTLERLHADDFELVPPPGTPLTREDYLGLVASGELDYRVFKPVSRIEVRVHGDAATMWYRSRIDIVAAGQGRLVHEAWHVCFYEMRDGRWQLVREQATAVGGFPPPGSAGQDG